MKAVLRLAIGAAVLLAAGACDYRRDIPAEVHVSGGSAARGEAALRAYDCGACHSIPGVRGARGVVAPPLDRFALRSFIAGRVPNSTENLIRWIMNPRTVDSLTAMPVLMVDPQSARDMAAYLYTLR